MKRPSPSTSTTTSVRFLFRDPLKLDTAANWVRPFVVSMGFGSEAKTYGGSISPGDDIVFARLARNLLSLSAWAVEYKERTGDSRQELPVVTLSEGVEMEFEHKI